MSIYTILTSLVLLPELIFPHYTFMLKMPQNTDFSTFTCQIEDCLPTMQSNTLNPIISHQNPYTVLNSGYFIATAYSSTPDQTDSSPFIAASGKWVYDGMIAANFLKFGTKIRLPQVFGDKIFTVDDRMHPRFSNRIDIWFSTRQEALQFGAKKVRVEIVK